MKGWLAAYNLDISCLKNDWPEGTYMKQDSLSMYDNLINKFPEDGVSENTHEYISFMTGYVYNKRDLMKSSEVVEWPVFFSDFLRTDADVFLNSLRGGFCGFLFEKKLRKMIVFTDHTGIKPVYYWCENDSCMVSNCLEYMGAVLKANRILYDFNLKAAQYMLTCGYMLDDSTFIQQIHRVLPGQYVELDEGRVRKRRFYLIPNRREEISEEEAVERIDTAFRKAIKREFEKDREYGYRHLVDLSGGLDSRMVSWVADEMGYTDQVNITYCQMGYRDDIISEEIARYLGHEYLFKGLDDALWMYDIDEITSLNNGAALYHGITGGNRMLRALNTSCFGIEHTGMIGDAILSTFYHDKELNDSKPAFGRHQYSERLRYTFDEEILNDYPCQELFAVYTRGMLGAQSSYITRQHYVETASPFMDVDFLNVVFSIPFEYRARHHIYLKWIEKKYPKASEFGWEKWGGVKPKESHIFFRKVKTVYRLLLQEGCKVFGVNNKDIMAPEDYWYGKNRKIQQFLDEYYKNAAIQKIPDINLRKDIETMFWKGTFAEKSMALTVLAMVKKYFD